MKEVDVMADVSAFMRDDPRLKTLVKVPEFPAPLMRIAIKMMVALFNRLVTTTAFTLEQMDELQLYDVALYGTAACLLDSASALQVANHLPGAEIGEFAKSQEYQALMQSYQRRFESGAIQYKHTLNIKAGFGAVSSPYAAIGSTVPYAGRTVG